MSYLSDPDRLERLAHYVGGDNTTPLELAAALNDAAERIRSNQATIARLRVRSEAEQAAACASCAELEDDLLYVMQVRHEVLQIAAAEVIPGPDGQDDIDRAKLIEGWVEQAHEEAEWFKRPLPQLVSQLKTERDIAVARVQVLERQLLELERPDAFLIPVALPAIPPKDQGEQ